MIFIFNVTWY